MRLVMCAVLLVVLGIAGCGNVDWFPPYKRQPTTPDAFSFTPQTRVTPGDTVTSNAITVAGLTATSSPISVTGSNGSNSKYVINGTDSTSTTVKNGDTVAVQHTAASTLGTDTTSTLVIGDVSATFRSTTKTVLIPAFTPMTTNIAHLSVTSAPVGLKATAASHQLRVLNGFFFINNEAQAFTTGTRSDLNNSTIRLNLFSPAFGQTTSAHLIIDDETSSFSVTTK